jgi:dihydroxyacid dehydratase/phosphogluconate dehydratase
LRSDAWLGGDDEVALNHRAALREAGEPVGSLPAFMVVRGILAPDGAVIKAAAASPRLLRHEGQAPRRCSA